MEGESKRKEDSHDDYPSSAAALVAAVLVAVAAGPVVAAPTPLSDSDRAAAVVAEALPADAPAAIAVPSDSSLSVAAGSVEVTAPASGDESVQLRELGADGTQLGVSLPLEASLGDAEVSAEGAIVYRAESSGSPQVVVNPLENGAVRIQTIIEAPDDLHQFTYPFDDNVEAVDTDAGVTLVSNGDGVSQVVGSVAAPWAVDAAGNPVDTRYEVLDGHLVQTVYPSPETTYPVVADPTVSIGWGVYSGNRTDLFFSVSLLLWSGAAG